MANVTLKKKTGAGTTETLYPRAHYQNIEGLLDISGEKLKASLLPDSVFDNLTYRGAISSATVTASFWKPELTSGLRKGHYFVVTADQTLISTGPINTGGAIPTHYLITTVSGDTDGGNATNHLEKGDWFIIDKLEDLNAGYEGANPIKITIAIVNNTYENATPANYGITKLSSRSSASALAGTDVITESVLGGLLASGNLSSGSSTKIARADHHHDDKYTPKNLGTAASKVVTTTTDGVLTAIYDTINSGTSIQDIANANSSTFVNIGNLKMWTGQYLEKSAVASKSTLGAVKLFSDTKQTVAANAITTTANKSYAVQLNTSNEMVVNVPWTDTIYSLPLATPSVRGGIKLGFSSTETSRAVLETGEQAYVTLPRAIPNLNGTGNGGSFYAPTTVGNQGQKQVSVGGAATWQSVGVIHHGTLPAWAEIGDILIE